MRLLWKWLFVSVCGAIMVTVFLFVFSESWVADVPGPVASFARLVLWPVAACVSLVSPDPADKHWQEVSPDLFLVVVIGVGLSWLFYSSLGFLYLWLWHFQHPATSSGKHDDIRYASVTTLKVKR